MPQPIRKILVPTDFSHGAKEALQRAIDFARAFGASITVLHAYQFPVYYFPDGSVFTTSATVAADIVTSVADALDKERQAVEAQGVTAQVASSEGQPAQAILEVAREHDLIVMGTHGRGGLRHLFLGSVAERVVRQATCPVVTVRMPA